MSNIEVTIVMYINLVIITPHFVQKQNGEYHGRSLEGVTCFIVDF